MTGPVFRLLTASVSLCAAAVASASVNDNVVPPSRDPFYSVPSDIEDMPPGTVLRHREPPSVLAAEGEAASYLNRSYQLLYRTTDGFGNATATVTTVLIPPNADYEKVVSLQVAEDASFIDCAPSFGFQSASSNYPRLASATAQVQLLLAEAALCRGWVVVVADAGGPTGASPAGKLNAYATLDGIRAALQSKHITNIEEDATVALWGYSGGGETTLDSVRILSMYAPELNVAGAALGGVTGGPPLNAYTAIAVLNKSVVAGLLPVLLQAYASQIPDLYAMLRKHVKPEYHDHFYSASTQCLEANKETFDGEDILAMFDETQFLSDFFEEAASLRVDDATPRVPLYWYQYDKDRLINENTTSHSVFDYCHGGSQIEYQIETAKYATHASYGLLGAPSALDWLDKALNGKVADQKCSTQRVNTPGLDNKFLSLYPDVVQKRMLAFINSKPG